MLTSNIAQPEEVENFARTKLLSYMRKFYHWSRKLNDEDLRTLCMFCVNVQNAWRQGQTQAATTVEQVAEGTAPIQMPLPGLGAPLDAPSGGPLNPEEI